MKLTGQPINRHLERINQSTNRILDILANVPSHSNRTVTSYQTTSQVMPLYKDYIKRKVTKLFKKLEDRVSLLKPQENLSEVQLKKVKPRITTVLELDDENFSSDETTNQVLTRKSTSNKSFSGKKSFLHKQLTPLNKRKVMRDYYYQKVKPHNSFIRRSNKVQVLN